MSHGESTRSAMRVLGVDPGLTRCGVGIVEGAVGSPITLVEVGVILTPTDAALEARLLDLDQQLIDMPQQLWLECREVLNPRRFHNH